MMITVVGFIPFDSGKTRLAARLVKGLRERGIKVSVVKPIGSHSLWQQHFSLEYSMEHGVLVGGDAIRLARAASVSDPARVQPVDMLLAPPDVTRYLTRLRDYLFSLESLISQVVMLRISTCRDEGVEHVHLLVKEHVDRLAPSIRDVVEELASRLRPLPSPIEPEMLKEIMSGDVIVAADMCASRIASRSEVTVIESFNDVVVPIPLSTRSEWFVAVAPGRAVVYHGSDVVKAASLLSGFRPGSIRAADILHLVKPVKIMDVKFVYSDDHVGEDIETLIDFLVSSSLDDEPLKHD